MSFIDGSTPYLYTCAEQSSGANLPIAYYIFTLDSSYDVFGTPLVYYTPLPTGDYSCKDIIGSSGTSFYSLVYESSSSTMYIARVSSWIAYYTELTTFTLDANNMLYQGRFKSTSEVYYVGYARKINTGSTTTMSSYNVAYLMSSASASSCVSVTDTENSTPYVAATLSASLTFVSDSVFPITFNT
jgi:hypothetical protein